MSFHNRWTVLIQWPSAHNEHEGRHHRHTELGRSKGAPGLESRTGPRLVSPAAGHEKKKGTPLYLGAEHQFYSTWHTLVFINVFLNAQYVVELIITNSRLLEAKSKQNIKLITSLMATLACLRLGPASGTNDQS